MSERGFSLVEILLLLAVLMTALAVAIGFWRNAADRYRLEAAGARFSSFLRSARGFALSGAAPLQVRIHPNQRGYSMAAPGEPARRWQFLPEGVEVDRAPRRPPTFFSRGQAVPAGSYRLAGRLGALKIVVAPSGRVRRENLARRR